MLCVLFTASMILAMHGGSASSAAVRHRPAKAAIHGVVLANGTNEPIAGAWVILARFSAKESFYAAYTSIPITPSATTDRDGRFEIHDIDPESYRLTIRRNGYARQVHGQRVENGHVPPIELGAGEGKDVVIHLTPAGSVSGVIRNTSGRPVSGTGVDLVRSTYTSRGNRNLQTVAQSQTNDRGEYRFYWITPGRYHVRAGEGGQVAVDRRSPIENYDYSVESGNNKVGEEYAETYYPGVRDLEKSIAIDVHPGSELRGTDIVVERQRGQFSVRGHMIDSMTGQPPLEGTVVVETATGDGYGYYTDDTFEPVPVFRPGTYWIGFKADASALSPSNRVPPVASAKVVVSDSDVDLALTLISPAVIKGRVSVDGELPPSVKLDAVAFETQPAGAVSFSGLGEGIFFAKARADADGAFRLHGIPGGEFRVLPVDLPSGFYLKEARLDGIDVLNARASFSTASMLELVISSGGGQIEGAVTDDRSDPMPNVQAVLVPDSRRDRTELFRTVNTDSEGRLSMTGIAPGDYRLFSWEALEPYAWFDSEVLARFQSMGKPIHVSESSAQRVQVRMIPKDGAP